MNLLSMPLKILYMPQLTLSWRRQLSYRNQSDLRSKLMDWFLYDNGLRHEIVNKDLTSVTLKQLKERLPVLIGK